MIRREWLPILFGLLLPAWNASAQTVADSIASADTLVSLPGPAFLQDSLTAVTTDTIVSEPDTVAPAYKKKKDSLDDPVSYESNDSMIWNNGGYASLYGSGRVNYQKIQLTAAVIKMQMDSSLVYADGVQDSAGNWVGTPVFVDGTTPYESNHISYNFKTEKGYINGRRRSVLKFSSCSISTASPARRSVIFPAATAFPCPQDRSRYSGLNTGRSARVRM